MNGIRGADPQVCREGLAYQTAGEILEALIEELDLESRLRSEGPEGRERAENVMELIAAARDFEAEQVMELDEGDRDAFSDLDLFLQHVALVTDLDFHDSVADAVTLMTLHSAKGLEFPVVFISGLEEGLFPLMRAYDEPRMLEEERRLFYVGITRAMDRLYMTHARRRRRAGETMYGRLSTFVDPLQGIGLPVRRFRLRIAPLVVPPPLRDAPAPAPGTRSKTAWKRRPPTWSPGPGRGTGGESPHASGTDRRRTTGRAGTLAADRTWASGPIASRSRRTSPGDHYAAPVDDGLRLQSGPAQLPEG